MTSTGEADRHYLFELVLDHIYVESGWPFGDSRLSLFPCTSVIADMRQTAPSLLATLTYISIS